MASLQSLHLVEVLVLFAAAVNTVRAADHAASSINDLAPEITNAGICTAYPNLPFSYQIRAEPEATWFGALGWPAWMSIETPSGLLRGIPPSAGDYRITVLASNLSGIGSNSLTIRASQVGSFLQDQQQTNFPPILTNVIAIASDFQANLALQGDGRVVGWGVFWFIDSDDTYPTIMDVAASVPATLSNVINVSCAASHAMALRKDGSITVLGLDYFDHSLIPTSLTNAAAIATAAFHSLALGADGTVAAWGIGEGYCDNQGQKDVPASATNVVAIAAGEYHSLALRADGTVVGWGARGSTCAFPSYGQANVPAGLTGVVAIAAGRFHSLALRSDGTVVGWGNNDYGQTDIPLDLSNVVAIAAEHRSVALKSDGTLVAWGSQSVVQPGLENIIAVTPSLALIGNATSLTAEYDRAGSELVLEWVDQAQSSVLQATSGISMPQWTNIPDDRVTDFGGRRRVTLNCTNVSCFFRVKPLLRRP